MTVLVTAPPGLPDGVRADELGRAIAPLELLVPYDENPRNPEDFDVRRSPAFRDLADSIDENGVREPINVFLKDDQLYMLNGHRRRAAVELLNRQRDEAYEARVQLGELSPDAPRPPELERIPGLPISLVPAPRNEFERQADMWVAESQRQKWPVNRLVPFYKKTYESAPEDVRKDIQYMSRRLGLPEGRIRLLNAIVNSEVLMQAATADDDDVLPVQGREKTLRSINRVAEVLTQYRPDVVIKATGRYQVDDDATRDLVREKVVNKASEYAHVHNIPPGVALERTAPELKDAERYSDDELVAWLTAPGTIATERLPTTVGSGGKKADGQPRLLDVLEQYEAIDVAKLTGDELNDRINELIKAGDVLDGLLASARSAKRGRVA